MRLALVQQTRFMALTLLFILATVLPLFLAPSKALAQQLPTEKSAVLVADQVFTSGNSLLIAEGNVEALFGTSRLKASRIVYDRRAESLVIDGPITITDGDNILILASSAELDRNLENGLLRGARLVLNQQLQLAAQQMNRVSGRYSQLYKVAVTSCRVCETGKPPLWQIRAKRVVHDQIARQLYFEGAQFRVRDVPVFYLPRLRLPDPTLSRAAGFMIPSIRRNSQLGTGVKIPYFIPIGKHRDITLTPYFSSEIRTIEYRYRQAYRRGTLAVEGAVSQDTLLPGQTRAYVFAIGRFALNHGYTLEFDIEATIDNSYLLDYDYSEKDRLDSEVAVTRTTRDEYIRAAFTQYHSLRVTENNATLPTLIGDVRYERRFLPKSVGGELRLGAEIHSHFRYSNLTTDGPDSDIWADGRDVTRLNANASWLRTWTLAAGLRASTTAALDIDSFHTAQIGSTADASTVAVTPAVAVSLRWPLRKTTATGVSYVIEPMAQVAWVGGTAPNVANDESTRVEFDEGNLLAISRFPSVDRREYGLSAALGANWTRYDPTGWQMGLSIGRVYRDIATSDFTLSSGLGGTVSDLLLAGYFKNSAGISFSGRGLFNNGFNVSKAEARAGWRNTKMAVGASYVWLGADVSEDRAATVSEWSIDGSYRISRHWIGTANWRYDVATNTTAQAGFGLQYRNECVDITLSASRRFTSSIILTPSTDFSFTVGLRGFSAKTSDKSYTRTCSN